MIDFNLSPNFYFFEFAGGSDKNRAAALGFLPALKTLAGNIFEPLLAEFKIKPLITSAFRCAELNGAAGGAETSQHLKGEAADFIMPGFCCAEIFEKIKNSSLSYGQLILEIICGKEWLHISLGAPYRAKDKCLQSFVCENGNVDKFTRKVNGE